MRRRGFLTLVGGVAIVWPLVTRAQRTAVIGFLGSTSAGPYAGFVAAFREGLSEIGYVEGENLTIEYRWAEGSYDRLPALAADLVGRKVDLIAASGGNVSALAAKNATSTIPIVFFTGGDPVGEGLVTSLARPLGNVTGVTFLFAELTAKRLELLSELVPEAHVIALLANPNSPGTDRMILDVEEAARAMRMQVPVLKASTETEVESAFASLGELHAGALLVGADPFFFSQRDHLLALASRHGIPAMYQYREFAAFGGLIAYGSSVTDAYRLVGIYAGRILKGAKPADLPVQQPTAFKLVVNLKTAAALRLTVPQSIFARADEIIE
jgi:putative tryptophan/tyrosine transport system substrate-binding protein